MTDEMHCKEFVELVTAYLDDALPPEERAEVEQHLAICDGCQTVLAQWRTVIDAAGHLSEDDVDNTDALTRDRLLNTFRRIRRR